ncbi:MAG: HEAT repeat domain-containing protein, partial [Thermoguttaceae bacterium]|nr:HEAT repeat domain-containing protein [Thermoguttaceae bacterium]
MKKYLLLLAIAAICFAYSPALSQQTDPVATLKAPAASGTLTDGELHLKAEALRQLTWNGPASAVDAIVPFLRNAKLASAAQTALLNLPDGVGIAAMRNELPKLTGSELCSVVAALGQARDFKSVSLFAKMIKHNDTAVVKAVLTALGKIGDEAACDLLQNQLTADDADIRQTAAAALLYAISNNETLSKRVTLAELLISSSASDSVKTGARSIVAALGTPNSPAYIAHCLESDDLAVFNRGIAMAVKRQMLFEHSRLSVTGKTLSHSRRAQVYDAFTASARSVTNLAREFKQKSNKNVVRCNPGTKQLLIDTKANSPLRLAALRCLGACCDDKEVIVKTVLPVLASKNPDEVQAAVDALTAAFVDIDLDVAEIVKHGAVQAQTAALTVIANRPKTDVGLHAVQAAIASDDVGVRKAAYAAFALLSEAQKADLATLFLRWNPQLTANETEALADAIFLLAKRTPDPAACCQFLLDQFVKAPEPARLFCFDVLAQIGNEDSLAAIVKCAQGGNDALLDKATQVLGQWINLDAAEFLLEIAKTCPVEKYRVRALRGYIRLVRQMGQNATQQLAMADAAQPFAVRKDEKELLRQLYARIEGQRKDKSVFDGRTFNNWEGDTGNVFRIQDGCIVAGSLE